MREVIPFGVLLFKGLDNLAFGTEVVAVWVVVGVVGVDRAVDSLIGEIEIVLGNDNAVKILRETFVNILEGYDDFRLLF